jgi:hypothetical protein
VPPWNHTNSHRDARVPCVAPSRHLSCPLAWWLGGDRLYGMFVGARGLPLSLSCRSPISYNYKERLLDSLAPAPAPAPDLPVPLASEPLKRPRCMLYVVCLCIDIAVAAREAHPSWEAMPRYQISKSVVESPVVSSLTPSPTHLHSSPRSRECRCPHHVPHPPATAFIQGQLSSGSCVPGTGFHHTHWPWVRL